MLRCVLNISSTALTYLSSKRSSNQLTTGVKERHHADQSSMNLVDLIHMHLQRLISYQLGRKVNDRVLSTLFPINYDATFPKYGGERCHVLNHC